MKRVIKVFGLLLLAGALFMGCSNGSSSSSDNNNNNNSNASNDGTGSGNGSSQSKKAIELSNGNWTLTIRATSTDNEISALGNATYKFTVQGDKYTIKSGTIDTESDLSTYGMSSYTDEEIEAAIAEMNETYEVAGFSATFSYDKTTKKLYMHMPMPNQYLEEASNMLVTLTDVPSTVKVTSNANKTMYTFTTTAEGVTATYTFTKD